MVSSSLVTMTRLFSSSSRWALIFGAVGLLGCGALDANAPNTLQREDLNNPVGAQLIVNGVRSSVSWAFGDALKMSGALTDEWTFGGKYGANLNLRDSLLYLPRIREDQATGSVNNTYYNWQTAYRDATIALTLLRTAAPPNTRSALIGEVFALRGFVLVSLAEQICSGFPIAHVDVSSDGTIVTPRFTSDPQTPDSGFTRALADFDSAIVYAGDSARIVTLARLGRARARLGLGHFIDANTAAAQVPADFSYGFIRTDLGFSVEFAGRPPFFASQFPIRNQEGTNGLDFVSANDPRVPVVSKTNGPVFRKYTETNPSIVLASSTEARLIQAEAQLAANPADPTWLNTLNALRQTVGLADTTDPGTTAGRVNLLFRERAFWLFGTAHRLGDFRRLMARYGRDSETLFPIGVFTNRSQADPYRDLTSIPFDGISEQTHNPKITGCLAD